jgi:hypothetical protein
MQCYWCHPKGNTNLLANHHQNVDASKESCLQVSPSLEVAPLIDERRTVQKIEKRLIRWMVRIFISCLVHFVAKNAINILTQKHIFFINYILTGQNV